MHRVRVGVDLCVFSDGAGFSSRCWIAQTKVGSEDWKLIPKTVDCVACCLSGANYAISPSRPLLI